MPALAPVIALELFSYGRAPEFPQFAPWALAVTVVLIAAEYARRNEQPVGGLICKTFAAAAEPLLALRSSPSPTTRPLLRRHRMSSNACASRARGAIVDWTRCGELPDPGSPYRSDAHAVRAARFGSEAVSRLPDVGRRRFCAQSRCTVRNRIWEARHVAPAPHGSRAGCATRLGTPIRSSIAELWYLRRSRLDAAKVVRSGAGNCAAAP